MKKFIAFLVTLFSIISLLAAQSGEIDTSRYRPSYGVFGLFNINSDAADFTKLPGIPNCCPQFTTGSGTGFTFGVEYELPLPSKFLISLRVGYLTNTTKLTADEATEVRVNDQAVPGQFQHIMNATLSNVFVQPMLTYNPAWDLFVHFGGSIGFVMGKTYDQSEQITQPSNVGVFTDTGTRTRNKYSGNIPDASSIAGDLKIGASWRFPINANSTLFLVPQAFYDIGLTNITSVQKKTGTDALGNFTYTDGSWKMSNFQIGVGIMYSPRTAPKVKIQEYKNEYKIDTVIVSNESVMQKKVVEGLGKTFSNTIENADSVITITTLRRTDTLFSRTGPKAEISTSIDVINIKTQFVTEAFNTLGRVFFDDSTANLSKFYNVLKSKDEFSLEKLKINPFVFHENILNIVGDRLVNNPKAEITLRGTSDYTTEGGSCTLARQRVEAVRDYLVNVWGINARRIKINEGSDCRPEDPTTTPSDSGYAENRRVEITSRNSEILAPVLRTKFSEVTDFNPTSIDILPSSKSGSSTKKGIVSWTTEGVQNGKTIFTFSGNGPAESVTEKIDRDLAKSLSRGTIDVTIKIKDVEGTVAEARKSIKVIKDTSDFEVQRFSLIHFAFSSDVIPERAKPDILKAIEGITEESKIQISGYTDILGTRQRNQELANGRAMNTADFIRANAPRADIISVKGYASSKFPPGIDSYGTDAERFLSRTVQIEILRKIK